MLLHHKLFCPRFCLCDSSTGVVGTVESVLVSRCGAWAGAGVGAGAGCGCRCGVRARGVGVGAGMGAGTGCGCRLRVRVLASRNRHCLTPERAFLLKDFFLNSK